MTLTLISPATIADAAEAAGSLPLTVWAAIRAQLAHGESYVLRDDAGRAVAVGGYYPARDGAGEAWLIVAGEARKHALQLVRTVRLTAAASAYAPIRTFVETDAGRRIVMLAGFTRETFETEIWQWRHRQCPSSGSAAIRPRRPKKPPPPPVAGSSPSSRGNRRSSTSKGLRAASAIAADRS